MIFAKRQKRGRPDHDGGSGITTAGGSLQGLTKQFPSEIAVSTNEAVCHLPCVVMG